MTTSNVRNGPSGSLVDITGADIDTVLASMNAATNPTKGFIRLATESDPTRWLALLPDQLSRG